jgi:hypothetical protein
MRVENDSSAVTLNLIFRLKGPIGCANDNSSCFLDDQ